MEQVPRYNIESLRFEGLTFGHAEGKDWILNSCDFSFPFGHPIWIKSPEGAGKSTLLQILAGLSLPQFGAYYINDKNVTEMSFEEFLPFRLNIGFTFDYGGLINNRTIQDNLALPLLYHRLLSPEDAVKKINIYLNRFEIQKFAHERPAHVPGRVRKIAILLRAFITDPQFLLLDDPSVGLGEGAQDEFIALIDEHQKHKNLRCLIISSYDERFMKKLNHQSIYLDNGTLYLEQGDPSKGVVGL